MRLALALSALVLVTSGRTWADPAPGAVIGAISAGLGYAAVSDEGADGDPTPEGWAPEGDLELGAQISAHWALLGTASLIQVHSQFEEYDAADDLGLDHYSATHLRVGGRAQLWIASRVFAGFGLDVAEIFEHDRWPGYDGRDRFSDVDLDLQLGVEVARFGHIAIRVSNTLAIGLRDQSAGYAAQLGIAYR